MQFKQGAWNYPWNVPFCLVAHSTNGIFVIGPLREPSAQKHFYVLASVLFKRMR